MKVYKDIVQGSEAWHELKYGKIGGSTSKGLFVDSDTLLIELLSARLEPFVLEDDGYVSADMQRGIELEPLGRERLSEYTGIHFNEVGWMESEECSILGISPDGISEDETVSCEIKSPGRKKHTATIFCDAIPSDNIHQCLHYFTVNRKLERHFFLSFRPESSRPMWVKELTRDSVIDLGSKSKPNAKAIGEWVEIALGNGLKLEAQLIESENKLSF